MFWYIADRGVFVYDKVRRCCCCCLSRWLFNEKQSNAVAQPVRAKKGRTLAQPLDLRREGVATALLNNYENYFRRFIYVYLVRRPVSCVALEDLAHAFSMFLYVLFPL